jgi:hypothetical protein
MPIFGQLKSKTAGHCAAPGLSEAPTPEKVRHDAQDGAQFFA